MKRNPNYKEIMTLLADKEDFTHSNTMSAMRLGDVYAVYSYSTLVALYDFIKSEWIINSRKYSVTTSKQQNYIKRVATSEGWAGNTLEQERETFPLPHRW